METNNKVMSVDNEVKNANKVFNARNRKSAAEFIRENGGGLDFVENPRTGKLFFACGGQRGYVSKKVKAVLDTVKISDLGYAEVHAINKDGEEVWMPTLFLVGKTNVKKHLEL